MVCVKFGVKCINCARSNLTALLKDFSNSILWDYFLDNVREEGVNQLIGIIKPHTLIQVLGTVRVNVDVQRARKKYVLILARGGSLILEMDAMHASLDFDHALSNRRDELQAGF